MQKVHTCVGLKPSGRVRTMVGISAPLVITLFVPSTQKITFPMGLLVTSTEYPYAVKNRTPCGATTPRSCEKLASCGLHITAHSDDSTDTTYRLHGDTAMSRAYWFLGYTASHALPYAPLLHVASADSTDTSSITAFTVKEAIVDGCVWCIVGVRKGVGMKKRKKGVKGKALWLVWKR